MDKQPRQPKVAKPPGYEKWTWAEINAGRKMSKGEKRGRRLAKSLGATEGPDGKIVPPTGEQAGPYYFVMIALLILSLIVAFFFLQGCQEH